MIILDLTPESPVTMHEMTVQMTMTAAANTLTASLVDVAILAGAAIVDVEALFQSRPEGSGVNIPYSWQIKVS